MGKKAPKTASTKISALEIMGHARAATHTIITVLVIISLVSFSALQIRYGALLLGLVPLPQANAHESANTAEVSRSHNGTITFEAEYCSEVVAANDSSNPNGQTSTTLSFNDSWFDKDSHIYDHDLATACSVLTAVCNSESQFYGDVEGAIPYAEKALGALGFSHIQTDSYALRSNILDQLAIFFVGSHDVATYVLASKTIPGEKGASDETLVFVGVRGSYGTEWLSNLKLYSANGELDHQGYGLAEQEVMGALEKYIRSIGAVPEYTKILVTGHSRGGAIANLLASDLNDRADTSESIATRRNIFAYTFASPTTTLTTTCTDSRYRNTFNIVNPSDIVPDLPLSSWGFSRYGRTLVLPDASIDTFAMSYETMQINYADNTGYANPCTTHDLNSFSTMTTEADKTICSRETLATPQGIAFIVQTLFSTDLSNLGYAHHPDTYIAWMQSIEPGYLVRN